MISWEHNPNNERIIDVMTSVLFESEEMNIHAHGYAMDVLHHYFGDFDDEWYNNYIGTEEFRGGRWPDGGILDNENALRFEKMFELYWEARSEWFSTLIRNLDRKNRISSLLTW